MGVVLKTCALWALIILEVCSSSGLLPRPRRGPARGAPGGAGAGAREFVARAPLRVMDRRPRPQPLVEDSDLRKAWDTSPLVLLITRHLEIHEPDGGHGRTGHGKITGVYNFDDLVL